MLHRSGTSEYIFFLLPIHLRYNHRRCECTPTPSRAEGEGGWAGPTKRNTPGSRRVRSASSSSSGTKTKHAVKFPSLQKVLNIMPKFRFMPISYCFFANSEFKSGKGILTQCLSLYMAMSSLKTHVMLLLQSLLERNS